MNHGIICNNLNSLPFVKYGIDKSMMADVVSYQLALLKMISADCKPAITQILMYHVEQPVSPWPKLEYRDFAFTGVTWL